MKSQMSKDLTFLPVTYILLEALALLLGLMSRNMRPSSLIRLQLMEGSKISRWSWKSSLVPTEMMCTCIRKLSLVLLLCFNLLFYSLYGLISSFGTCFCLVFSDQGWKYLILISLICCFTLRSQTEFHLWIISLVLCDVSLVYYWYGC